MGNKLPFRILRGILCFAFWILVWQLLALVVKRVLVLPTPLAVAKTLLTLLGTGEFYIVCLWSLGRIFAGLMVGLFAGVLLAVLCAASRFADALISPAVSVIKATPIASVIILMLYVLGKGTVPMVATLLMVIPIVFVNVCRGIGAVPTDQREVARIYGFGFSKRVRYLMLPSVLPYFVAACRSALGLAWKAGIAAEVICMPSLSIGEKLHDAKIYLESEELYAWTIVVVLLSVLIEKGVVLLLSKLSKKGGVGIAEA